MEAVEAEARAAATARFKARVAAEAQAKAAAAAQAAVNAAEAAERVQMSMCKAMANEVAESIEDAGLRPGVQACDLGDSVIFLDGLPIEILQLVVCHISSVQSLRSLVLAMPQLLRNVRTRATAAAAQLSGAALARRVTLLWPEVQVSTTTLARAAWWDRLHYLLDDAYQHGSQWKLVTQVRSREILACAVDTHLSGTYCAC